MMKAKTARHLLTAFTTTLLLAQWTLHAAETPARNTNVDIVGEDLLINGQPTFAGRSWNGHRIEGLLLNSRMVQALSDDLSPETAKRWAYPDSGQWDAHRNLRELIAAMPEWRRHGVTVNFQGGSRAAGSC